MHRYRRFGPTLQQHNDQIIYYFESPLVWRDHGLMRVSRLYVSKEA